MAKKTFKGAGALPYSDAVLFDGGKILEVYGKLGIIPANGKLADGFEAQAKFAIENMLLTIKEAGLGVENIVKVRIYLTEMENYRKMNEVYANYFKSDYPARVALAVKGLPLGALIEIECMACGD